MPRFFGRFLYLTLFVFLSIESTKLAIASTGTFIDKQNASDLRVVSYNVNFDSIFDESSDSPEKFERLVTAIKPDILNLQEIYNYTGSEVATLMDSVAPLPGGTNWYGYDRVDNIILSKYPIVATGPIGLGGASALIDLPDTNFAKDFLVLNDHWRCCDNEVARQEEADVTVNDLKNFRNGNGVFSVAQDTPYVVLGDLNIVSSGQPLDTVITGNIIDEFSYGPDSPPDWDGTSITDSNPVHNGSGTDDWTWRNDSSQFAPGTLDYILYSDSVLNTANKFVLNTTTMTNTELNATGLEEFDVVLFPESGTYDHLPLIVDFRFTEQVLAGDYNGDGKVDAADYTVWRDSLGQQGVGLAADGNGNGEIEAGDYALWVEHYGEIEGSVATSVPEPTGALLLVVATALVGHVHLPLMRRVQRNEMVGTQKENNLFS